MIPKTAEFALRKVRRQFRYVLAFAIIYVQLALPGCSIVDTSVEQSSPKSSLLSPLSPGIDAVQLDIVYVERDEKDPLLAQMLWGEIDQVGTVDLQTRSRLRDAGFRVGLVGMSPPRSLQRLLGFSNDPTDSAGTSRHSELAGRSVLLRSGGDTEIQTSVVYPELTIQLPGEDEPRTLLTARFVLRAQLERLQDGWVNLHLTPEIHHGQSQLRPVAGAANWELKGTQEVLSMNDLQFTVALNVGEMVVLSADSETEESLGDQFFVNRDVQRPQRRMIVVRLSDMRKIEPLYTD
ncbi:MAG: hypothetical protein ACE37I_09845 [Rubinisphaera brasiliensis]|uniref:Uncharacterized protein n=1 Tax=Rubinisphaera brasiliensis (strain ATCC 49424 / DSM 5305 / JCM 21570 / IAM 15109 / NBRC 103401 / IFAM 1448) TaxID=756272 RepID=F0SM84_RUBBR|nr:hypothetical protein [Rubinisphaera brasiliensis]ADY61039.1 hypothetical protein Plabr_3442 [Rubinisphaera brasiliensis DSM 5305]MBR9801855.1 hypothetical protein [bacterium]